jgi:hypothetical protein
MLLPYERNLHPVLVSVPQGKPESTSRKSSQAATSQRFPPGVQADPPRCTSSLLLLGRAARHLAAHH